jgi:hypothetical protein
MKVSLQYFVFWGVFPSLYLMQTLFFTLNEQELTIIKNLLISASLVLDKALGHSILATRELHETVLFLISTMTSSSDEGEPLVLLILVG